MVNVGPEVGNNQVIEDLSGASQISVMPYVEVKTDVDNDDSRGSLNLQSSLGDTKVQSKASNDMSENSKVNDLRTTCSKSSDHKKAQGAERTSEAGSNYHSDKAYDITGDPCQIRRELNGLVRPMEMQKSSPEPKYKSGSVKEESKSEGNSLNSATLTSQQRMVVSVWKSSSNLSNTEASKSSAPENLKPADTQNSNLNTKQSVSSENNISIKKDLAVSGISRDEVRQDVLRKSAKEHSKSSMNPLSKVSHYSRTLHANSK